MKECAANSALFFTGDKESTLLLELRKGLDIPIIFVDTGLYSEELYHYLKLAEEHWGFNAIVLKDEKVVEESTAFGKEECYKLLKEKVVVPYLKKEEIFTLIEPMKVEKAVVKNDKVKEVHPLSGFSELEIWQLIKDHNLPYCWLYTKGYKDVGCEPCSKSETSKEEDEEEVSRRLKSLGYL